MARTCDLLFLLAALIAGRIAFAGKPADRDYFGLTAGMPSEMAKSQVEEFKVAVASRSCFRVAALTRFPLPINRPGKTTWIDNRTAFCRYFPILFDDARSATIANQKLEEMPAGWRGLMFGLGDFWLGPACANNARDISCPEAERRLWLVAANLDN